MAKLRGYTGIYCNQTMGSREETFGEGEDEQTVIVAVYCPKLSTEWDEKGIGWCEEHAEKN